MISALCDAGPDGDDDAVDAAGNDVAEGWATISAKVSLEACMWSVAGAPPDENVDDLTEGAQGQSKLL